MKKQILLIASIVFAQLTNASQVQKVLIIGVDGTRSDALQKANTPHLDAIISTSFFTYESWHRGITISGPSWSSIMCGVEYKKHGVTDNTYSNSNFNQYPYFTTHAKTCLPDLYCVQITQWPAMSDYVYNDSWDKKIIVEDGNGAQSVSEAQTQLTNPNLDVLFVYFDEVDLAGHASGFSPSNPAYLHAIETVDGHIGSIVTALHNRPTYQEEEWIILITTDHGGLFTGHGGDTPWERGIWWIGQGNQKTAKQLTGVKDPGSIHIGIYDPAIAAQSPGPCDIAVTALDHLLKRSDCKPVINPKWDLDGKSWLDSMYVNPITGVHKDVRTTFNFNCYPNPSNQLVTLWYDNSNHEKVSYEITDSDGKNIGQKMEGEWQQLNKLTIDFHNQSKGIYFITLRVGKQKQTKKIVIE